MLRKITLALACMFAFGYAESVGDINLVKKVKNRQKFNSVGGQLCAMSRAKNARDSK